MKFMGVVLLFWLLVSAIAHGLLASYMTHSVIAYEPIASHMTHSVISIELPAYTGPIVEPPKYTKPVLRVIPASELVTSWEAWGRCKGDQCID